MAAAVKVAPVHAHSPLAGENLQISEESKQATEDNRTRAFQEQFLTLQSSESFTRTKSQPLPLYAMHGPRLMQSKFILLFLSKHASLCRVYEANTVNV